MFLCVVPVISAKPKYYDKKHAYRKRNHLFIYLCIYLFIVKFMRKRVYIYPSHTIKYLALVIIVR